MISKDFYSSQFVGTASGINGALYLTEGNTAQVIAEFCFAGASLILSCTKLFKLSENGASSSFFAAAGFGRAAGSAKSALGIGRELVGGPLILFKLSRRSENE